MLFNRIAGAATPALHTASAQTPHTKIDLEPVTIKVAAVKNQLPSH
jgi:hypothetical protein